MTHYRPALSAGASQAIEQPIRGPRGFHVTVTNQPVGYDERCVRGDDVVTGVVAASTLRPRRSKRAGSPRLRRPGCAARSPTAARGRERESSRDECRPAARGRSARSRPRGADDATSAVMPASSHASLTTVSAIDAPAAMPPPTRLSSRPGSIGLVALRRAIHIRVSPLRVVVALTCAACVAMPKKRAAARSISNNARRCQIDGDRVALVPPSRERTFGRERARDGIDRSRACRRIVERRVEADGIGRDVENVAEASNPLRPRGRRDSPRRTRRRSTAAAPSAAAPARDRAVRRVGLQCCPRSRLHCRLPCPPTS